jgi:hypothetical protein
MAGLAPAGASALYLFGSPPPTRAEQMRALEKAKDARVARVRAEAEQRAREELEAREFKRPSNFDHIKNLPKYGDKNPPKYRVSRAMANQQISVDLADLFQDDATYDPVFDAFIESFPSASATVNEVHAWLKTWFDLAGVFEDDIGVDQYLNEIELNGIDLRNGKLAALQTYLICYNS